MTAAGTTEGRRILVTGATGFVGRHLVRNLAEAGPVRLRLLADGAAIDDLPAAARPVAELVTPGPAGLRGLCEGVDAVLHLDLAHGARSVASIRRRNVDATLNLALQAAEAGVRRFVMLAGGGADDRPLDQAGPHRATTRLAEAGLRELATRTGLAPIIVRPCLMAGEGQTGGPLLTLFRLCRHGVFPAMGDLGLSRSIVDVEDVAKALILAIDQGEPGSGYPVSSGVHHEFGELLAVAGTLVGNPRPYLRLPRPVGRWTLAAGDRMARLVGRAPPWSDDLVDLLLGHGRANIERTRRELGYAPHFRDLRAMLARTYAWFGMSGQL